MSNLAHKTEFIPRSGLQRTLKYHPHIKWIYKSSLVFDGLVWFACIVAVAPDLLQGSLAGALLMLAVISVVPLLLVLQTRYILRPLALSTIQVFNDRLEIECLGKTTQIFYRDIEKVKFSRLRNMGGWFKLITKHGNYKFAAVLERGEYILESITSFNRELIPVKELESYRKTAIQCDHSWAFFGDHLPKRKEIVAKYLVMPALAAVAILVMDVIKHHTLSFQGALLAFFGAALCQFLLSGFAFSVVSAQVGKRNRVALELNPNQVMRDLKLERRLVQASSKYQKILFGAIVVLYCLSIMLG